MITKKKISKAFSKPNIINHIKDIEPDFDPGKMKKSELLDYLIKIKVA